MSNLLASGQGIPVESSPKEIDKLSTKHMKG
jgi:hypothetical protein